MTEQELQAIEERASKATPGAWIANESHYDIAVFAPHPSESGNTLIAEIDGGISEDSKRDADFIAHARTDVPALIAEVRSLRAKLDAVPVMAILQLTKDAIDDAWSRKTLRAVRPWLKTQAVSA